MKFKSWQALLSWAISIILATAGILLLRSRPNIAACCFSLATIIATGRLSFRWIDGFSGSVTVRRILRLTIEASIVFLAPSVLVFSGGKWWAVLAGIGIGVAGLLPQWKTLTLVLSNELLVFMEPKSADRRFADIISIAGSPVVQETFHRMALIEILRPVLGWWVIPLSVVTFVSTHVLCRFSDFQKSDFVYQGGLSVGLASLYFATNSWAACVAGHLVFNAPGLYKEWRCRQLQDPKYLDQTTVS
jgi:hypothetical protein